MAAEIYGRDIQVGIQMAWHELTQVVPEINESNCGILYPMELQQLQLPSGYEVPHFITVAGDDGLPIGNPVGPSYTLISNSDIWKAVHESLQGISHEIVSTGTIRNRECGFISIKLTDRFVAAQRETDSVMNIMWGHGGSMNVIARTGMTVVVCANTFNAALATGGEFDFKVRHSGNVNVKLDKMKNAIESHLIDIDMFADAMGRFDQQLVSKSEAKKFFAGFVVEDAEKKEKISTRSQNSYTELFDLFKTGKGNKGETAADLFNAATDYYTHGPKTSTMVKSRRFESSEFGTGNDRKIEIFSILDGLKTPRAGSYEDCIERGELVLAKVAA